jgi:hypothetical protein
VQSHLSALPAHEAQALRAQFKVGVSADGNDEGLLALAEELSRLTRMKKKS